MPTSTQQLDHRQTLVPRSAAAGEKQHYLSVELRPDLEAPRRCRQTVERTLSRWGWTGRQAEVAELLVSELASNAVIHAGSALRLSLLLSGERIRIEVADRSRTLPELRPRASGGAGGWGLRLIDQLSTRWDAERRLDGKVVWAELEL
jgi:anti-sigma regulatory factor (Ser/Thr protein kinase)